MNATSSPKSLDGITNQTLVFVADLIFSSGIDLPTRSQVAGMPNHSCRGPCLSHSSLNSSEHDFNAFNIHKFAFHRKGNILELISCGTDAKDKTRSLQRSVSLLK